jgi:rhodanese-related sulfurtransferase
MREINREAFASARADGAYVIDVREPAEYVAGHIPGVRLMPMATVSARLAEIPRNTTVYVVCATGNRSGQVTGLLLQAGYDAWSVAGGTSGWQSDGHPVVQGTAADVAA